MTEDIYTKAEARRIGFIAVAKDTLGLFGGMDKIMALAREIEEFVVRPATEIGTASVTVRPRITEPASLNLLMGVADEYRYYTRLDAVWATEYRAKAGAGPDDWAEFTAPGGGSRTATGWTRSAEIRVRQLTGARFVQIRPPADRAKYRYFECDGTPLVYRARRDASSGDQAEFNSNAGKFDQWTRSPGTKAGKLFEGTGYTEIPDPTERTTT